MAYIDRDALLIDLATSFIPQSMDYTNAVGIAKRWLKEAPVADVEPVVHGHWDFVEREAFWITDIEEIFETGKPTKQRMPVCSNCKTEFGLIVLRYKRCPECGAYMEKDGDCSG